jgi:hypothetical protein
VAVENNCLAFMRVSGLLLGVSDDYRSHQVAKQLNENNWNNWKPSIQSHEIK